MSNFDQTTEQKLAEDIKVVIQYANEGMLPDDAITKVAEEEAYNPDLIKTVCGVFNKSKAASYLQKMSSDKRADNFSLADPYKVIRKIYGQEKAAESTATLPSDSFADIDLQEEFDKEAEATGEGQGQGEGPQGKGGTGFCYCPSCGHSKEHTRNEPCNKQKCPECDTPMTGVSPKEASELSFDAVQVKLDKYAGLYKRASEEYDFKIAQRTHKIQDCLEKLADRMGRLPPDKLKKTAQLTVNGYPSFGQRILDLVQTHMTRPIPKVEKTAFAAVFPSDDIYVKMSELCDNAYELRDLKLAKKAFEKNAGAEQGVGKFLRWVTTNTVPAGELGKDEHESFFGKSLRGAGNFSRGKLNEYTSGDDRDPAASKITKMLGPDVYNSLKEIDAKKNFILLSLYDKHLNKYDMSELADAYNDVVASVPTAYNDPSALKPMMLRYLEQGGYKDIYTYDLEQGIRKNKMTSDRAEENDLKKKFEEIKTDVNKALPPEKIDPVKETEQSKASKRRQKGNIEAKGKNAVKALNKAVNSGNAAVAKDYAKIVQNKYPDMATDPKVVSLMDEAERLKTDKEKSTNKGEADDNDKNTYMSALHKAVSSDKLDKADDIVDDIHENYPEVEDTPEFRELIRDLEEKERKSQDEEKRKQDEEKRKQEDEMFNEKEKEDEKDYEGAKKNKTASDREDLKTVTQGSLTRLKQHLEGKYTI